MENLHIQGSKKTPTIHCDFQNGKIEISGISIPNVATPFYEPVIKWIKQYAKAPRELTEIVFSLVHFDSDSSKCIFDLLKIVNNELHDKGAKVEMVWFFDDEDLYELGEDYSSLLGFPVKLIKSIEND